MRSLRYLHLDVFTERPLEGNQLAVFTDGAGVDARLMQRIAREMAFPESTFLLPKEDPSTDVRTATGAASGPLGCYLVHHGVVPEALAGKIVSNQGVRMGRPSQIHIAIGLDGKEIVEVKVGGQAVVLGEGTLSAG